MTTHRAVRVLLPDYFLFLAGSNCCIPADSFGRHSPRRFYSQHASGSEHSFASIETVTDLGFTKHGDASNAISTSTSHLGGVASLHQDQVSNADSVHSDEETEEEHAVTLAARLRSLNEDGAKFLPISDIQRTLTSYNVRRVLKETFSAPSLSEVELDQLTQDICGAPQDMSSEGQPRRASRQRLFALLLLAEKPQFISCFVECAVDDSDLPFMESPSRKTTQAGLSKDLTLHARSDVELKRALKCFDGRSPVLMEWFVKRQYAVLSPFFDLDSENVCLYHLPSDIVLPFIESKEADEGGQATVSRVLIHPAHHNFRFKQVTIYSPFKEHVMIAPNKNEKDTENPYFAVKRLHSHRRDDYQKEVEVLQRFSGKNKGHPHLIRLLLTYRHGENFHMIFRWADGNLRRFWESHPSPKRHQGRATWMLTQCHGIADGLQKIHGSISKGDLSPNDKNTGRHGDIKPENILWFKHHDGRDNHLLISDFGLSRFHSYKSQSEDKPPGFSPSYRPPECDLSWLTITVKYDIWTLGCLLLEFITWYLLGFEAVNTTFTEARLADEEGWVPNKELRMGGDKSFVEDKFFITYRDRNIIGAKLKPSVVTVSPHQAPAGLRIRQTVADLR